eukprot:3899563-Rhodomonas_salina.4
MATRRVGGTGVLVDTLMKSAGDLCVVSDVEPRSRDERDHQRGIQFSFLVKEKKDVSELFELRSSVMITLACHAWHPSQWQTATREDSGHRITGQVAEAELHPD